MTSRPILKALTLWRPWDYAISHLNKRLENRTWKPPKSIIGKRIAIHSGKKLDKYAVETLEMELATEIPDLPHSVITCTAIVKGWIDKIGNDHPQHYWWAEGIAWVLDDVFVLPEPIPCRGAQGLWTVPPDIARAVLDTPRGMV